VKDKEFLSAAFPAPTEVIGLATSTEVEVHIAADTRLVWVLVSFIASFFAGDTVSEFKECAATVVDAASSSENFFSRLGVEG